MVAPKRDAAVAAALEVAQKRGRSFGVPIATREVPQLQAAANEKQYSIPGHLAKRRVMAVSRSRELIAVVQRVPVRVEAQATAQTESLRVAREFPDSMWAVQTAALASEGPSSHASAPPRWLARCFGSDSSEFHRPDANPTWRRVRPGWQVRPVFGRWI